MVEHREEHCHYNMQVGWRLHACPAFSFLEGGTPSGSPTRFATEVCWLCAGVDRFSVLSVAVYHLMSAVVQKLNPFMW